MKKLVINETQLETLKNLLFEAKIAKALPKLAIDDFLLITNKSGEQVKYTVLMNMGTVVYFKTIQKKTNKSFFVWMSVTSIGEDNTLEIRSLEDHPRNSKKIKHPDTWGMTTLKDISGIEVFDKDKKPKFKIDVDDNPSDDHTTDELQPKPNQPFIDGKIDRDGNKIKPKPEQPTKKVEFDKIKNNILNIIKTNNLENWVTKNSSIGTLHKLTMKGNLESARTLNDILVKTFTNDKTNLVTTKTNNKSFVDNFKVNKIVKIELLDDDYQFGSLYLDIGREYSAKVIDRKENDGVLLKIIELDLRIKLTKEIKNNVYKGVIRAPNNTGGYYEEEREISVDNRI